MLLRVCLFILGSTALMPSASAGPAVSLERTAAAAVDASSGGDWDLFLQAQNYEEGKGVTRNWRKARQLYERVIQGPNREAAGFAALALGKHYLKPGSRKPEKAATYFKTGVSLEEPWSMMQLAEIYERGGGVMMSLLGARDLYTRAASGRDPKATMYAHAALGRLHTRRPLRDTNKAIHHLQRAIALGDYWSAYPLIKIYAGRRNTAKNRARIRELLLVLRNSGDPKAVESAGYLRRKLRTRIRSE